MNSNWWLSQLSRRKNFNSKCWTNGLFQQTAHLGMMVAIHAMWKMVKSDINAQEDSVTLRMNLNAKDMHQHQHWWPLSKCSRKNFSFKCSLKSLHSTVLSYKISVIFQRSLPFKIWKHPVFLPKNWSSLVINSEPKLLMTPSMLQSSVGDTSYWILMPNLKLPKPEETTIPSWRVKLSMFLFATSFLTKRSTRPRKIRMLSSATWNALLPTMLPSTWQTTWANGPWAFTQSSSPPWSLEIGNWPSKRGKQHSLTKLKVQETWTNSWTAANELNNRINFEKQ